MSDPALPMTFTEGRVRTAALLVVAVVLAVGSWIMATGDEGSAFMWAGVVLFGVGIPLFVWSLVNPQQLVVDEEGVTSTSPPNRKIHVPWELVDRFEVTEIRAPGAGRAGRMVGFQFVPDAHERRPDIASGPLAQAMSQSVAGVDGAFPSTNCYGEDPDELIELLERLRIQRQGRPPA